MKFDEFIEGAGTIEEIKAKFGDGDIVINGIPKDKFNAQLSELKLARDKIKEMEISNNELLKKFEGNEDLATMVNKLKLDLENKDKEFANFQKKEAVKAKLLSAGVVYPDLVINALGDIEDVEKLDLAPIKEKYPQLFPVETTEGSAQSSPKGGVNSQNAGKEILVQQYNEAEKRKDYALMLAISRKIKEMG